MRLIFMGTPETAVPSLRRCLEDGHQVAAVWTQPDRPSGRGNRTTASPVKQYALAAGLVVHQPSKIKTPEAIELFRSADAEAAVVVAYGRILPPSFLVAPPRGCINVHFSLLPKYRGAAPVNWAVINGEEKTGVTTMQMDAGLDTGPILLQRETPVGNTETAEELAARLAAMGADLLGETLHGLDRIVPRRQTESGATHAPLLRKEDGVINWRSDAFAIARRVRGLQPWPTAYTRFETRRIVIRAARGSLRSEQPQAEPGVVVNAHGDDLRVACGDGTALIVEEIQPEGKRRMSVRDFLNGVRLEPGARFG